MTKVEIEWTYYDGEAPATALPKLKRFISDRQAVDSDRLEYWYVGQTLNPRTRLTAHQTDCAHRRDKPWTHAFVIYGAPDVGSVTLVENGLIDYLRRRATRRGEEGRALNAAGARCAGDQKYHVYVLVDDHPQSSSGAKAHRAADAPNWDHCYRQRSETVDEARRNRTLAERLDRALSAPDSAGGRPVRYCYIGMTNEPARRLREHQGAMARDYGGNLWEEMRVVYETDSFQAALDAEAAMIAHAQARGDVTLHNAVSGSRGAQRRAEQFPYYYVYYLEDRR